MTTLGEALSQASRYWATKRNASVMSMRAKTCVECLKRGSSRQASSLTQTDAIHVLEGLKARGLSSGSQASYYAAFRRMLALSGVSTIGWPAGATPPRRTREPLHSMALTDLLCVLEGEGLSETLDLLHVLAATGMRVDVEALSFDSWETRPGQLLRVTGKGGHTRLIPVEDPEAWAILTDTYRANKMRRLTYSAHLKRWKKATARAGITSKLPTPHAIRHYYATQAYARCKDLRVVQELLGHADISTTGRYIGADMDAMRAAVST